MKPKVSVIIPIYNVEKYLDRCIKSVINQTLQDIEIILVDDGSPDNCPQMCDEYAKHDGRITVIHKKNAGQGLARNDGLKIASGEFVAFIDSDDCIDANMYESLYEMAQKYQLDICRCSFNRFYQYGIFSYEKCRNNKLILAGKTEIDSFLLMLHDFQTTKINMTSPCFGIYAKNIIDDNKLKFLSEREFASEDLLFNMDYISKSTKLGYTPDPFYHYFYNNNSTTTNYNKAKYNRMIKLLYAVDERMSNYFKDIDYKPYLCSQILRIFKIILKYEVIQAQSLSKGSTSLKEAFAEPVFLEMINCEQFTSRQSKYNKILLSCLKHKQYKLLYLIQLIKLKVKK